MTLRLQRLLSAFVPDADDKEIQARGLKYGEQGFVNFSHGLAPFVEEGSLFVATNPTPGTGIAQGILAALDPQKALLSLRNNNSAGGKNIIPIYLSILNTVVPASATRADAVIVTDAIGRYASGGSAITPVNANQEVSNTTGAVVHFGTLVLNAAGGGNRQVARQQLFGAIPVVQSQYVLNFGLTPLHVGAMNGGGVQRVVTHAPPVIIPPQFGMFVQPWYPGNAATGASWEFELVYLER